MYPKSFSQYPSIYHIKNRFLLIGACLFLIVINFLRFREETRIFYQFLSGFSLFLWTYVLLIALRRRLQIDQDGIEYNGEFNAIWASWSEVKAIETRRGPANLWMKTEGLLIRTNIPDAKEYFIDLRQFGRSWRDEPLGAVLRMKAPHLFPAG